MEREKRTLVQGKEAMAEEALEIIICIFFFFRRERREDRDRREKMREEKRERWRGQLALKS